MATNTTKNTNLPQITQITQIENTLYI